MRKLMQVAMLAAVVGLCWAWQAAPAQEAETPKLMTQGELAQLLVKKLGLYRALPANPTDLECIMVLSQNGVYPATQLKAVEDETPGWSLSEDAEATMADLVILLVRALGLEDEVEGDMQDEQNWVNVLKAYEIPFDSIGEGVAQLTPLTEIPVMIPLFQISEDPLRKRFIPESDSEDIFDLLALPDIGPVATAETGEVGEEGPPPTPVTQN